MDLVLVGCILHDGEVAGLHRQWILHNVQLETCTYVFFIFFQTRYRPKRSYIRAYTHLYECTHAHPISMSISKRLSRHIILKFMKSLRAPHYRRERLLPPKAHRQNFWNKLRNNASIRTWTLVGRGYRWGIDSYVCWVVCLGLALAIFLALSEQFFLVAKKAEHFFGPGNNFWKREHFLNLWFSFENMEKNWITQYFCNYRTFLKNQTCLNLWT